MPSIGVNGRHLRGCECPRAVEDVVGGAPLAGSKIYLAGTAATYKEIAEGAKCDLMIAGIAALVIVGNVALSSGASFRAVNCAVRESLRAAATVRSR